LFFNFLPSSGSSQEEEEKDVEKQIRTPLMKAYYKGRK